MFIFLWTSWIAHSFSIWCLSTSQRPGGALSWRSRLSPCCCQWRWTLPCSQFLAIRWKLRAWGVLGRLMLLLHPMVHPWLRAAKHASPVGLSSFSLMIFCWFLCMTFWAKVPPIQNFANGTVFLSCLDLDFSSSFHTPGSGRQFVAVQTRSSLLQSLWRCLWILRWTEFYTTCFGFEKNTRVNIWCTLIYYFVSAYNVCIIYSVDCILLYMFIPIYLPYKFQTTWGRLRPGLLRCFREWPGPALCRQRPLQWSPGCLGSCTELCWSYGLCRCHGVFTMGEMHSWWCMGYVM